MHFPLNHWESKFSPNLAAYNSLYFINWCEFISVKVSSRITEEDTTDIGRFVKENESKTVWDLLRKIYLDGDGTDT